VTVLAKAVFSIKIELSFQYEAKCLVRSHSY